MRNKKTEDVKVFEETMENEIRNRKIIPDDVKRLRDENVFRNLLFAVGTLIFFIILNLGYFFIEKTIYTRDTAAFAFVALIITIILFEKSYRMEKGFFAVHGIETLVISIYTYFIPYTYFNLDEKAIRVLMIVPVFFGIYYCIKSMFICANADKKKKNDIKEIIKKENVNKDDISIDIDKDAELEEIHEEKIEKVITKTRKPISIKKQTAQRKKTTTKKDKEKSTKKTTTKRENSKTKSKKSAKTAKSTKSTRSTSAGKHAKTNEA